MSRSGERHLIASRGDAQSALGSRKCSYILVRFYVRMWGITPP
jgi:hypothetical protein